jgi:ankyrin repeat domain-containing protein 50
VRCQLDHLADQRKGRDIQNVLKGIPKGLDETNENMLCRIPAGDRDIAKAALLWLTYAHWPLSLNELSEAIVIKNGDSTLEEDSRLCRPEDILDICGNLISFDPKISKVALSHSSVRTYLRSDQIQNSAAGFYHLDDSSANRILAESCLTYLLFSDFATGPRNKLDLDAELAKWPLLHYAAHLWATHAGTLDIHDQRQSYLQQLISNFFATAEYPIGGNFSS